MKPREELKDVVWETVTADVLSLKDKAERIVQHTGQLAIGRWVSVEERLPELNEDGRFVGLVYTADDRIAAGTFDWEICGCITTHWLELDMPEEGKLRKEWKL